MSLYNILLLLTKTTRQSDHCLLTNFRRETHHVLILPVEKNHFLRRVPIFKYWHDFENVYTSLSWTEICLDITSVNDNSFHVCHVCTNMMLVNKLCLMFPTCPFFISYGYWILSIVCFFVYCLFLYTFSTSFISSAFIVIIERNDVQWLNMSTQRTWCVINQVWMIYDFIKDMCDVPGARPTKHISIEFEIRWKFRML